MSDVKGPESVSLKDVAKLIGRYAVMYRNNQKVPAKIIRVDEVEKRLVYELIAGPEKGMKKSSKYDEAQSALVYDLDNLNLAILDT